MARSVADLTLALQVLANPDQDDADPSVGPIVLRDPENTQIAGLRIGVYESDAHLAATPAVRRVVREATRALQEAGAQIEVFTPPDVDQAWCLYMGLSYADGMIFLQRLLKGSRRDWRIGRLFAFAEVPTPLRPALDWLLRACGQNYLANAFGSVSRQSLSAARYFELLDAEQAYRDRFKTALDAQRLDAIVCPASPLPATTHGNEYATFQGLASALYNLLGMPAGVVAASRIRPGEESDRPPSVDLVSRAARLVEQGSAGLPVGVQVVARHWREDVVLAIMAELERWFRTQPDYPLRPPI
jgi:fatty acid amide hydrolase